MAKQEIKFKVTIKELSFEYEGTREVGQALQAGLTRSLGNLMDTQRGVMAPSPTPAPLLLDANPTPEAPPVAPAAPATARRPRKANGNSLTALLRELKAERFFTEPQSAESIRARLKVKGHTHEPKNIASRLQDLTKKSELYRQESGDGYVYKDTPFNESPRASDPPAESAE